MFNEEQLEDATLSILENLGYERLNGYDIDRINGETSVRPNMKVEYFTSYEIKKIDLEKQNNFCLRAESIMKKIQNNKVENYNLEQLRDTLLPKLMNGEIDLDNIEI